MSWFDNFLNKVEFIRPCYMIPFLISVSLGISSILTPLSGDKKYGSKENKCDVALFSNSIKLVHPATGESVSFTAFPRKEDYPWNLFGADLYE